MSFLCLLCAACTDNTIAVNNAKNCVVVALGPMKIGGRLANDFDGLEFRSGAQGATAMMVSAVSTPFGPSGSQVASNEKFTFDLNDPRRPRRVDDKSWESGKPSPLYQRPIVGKFPRAGTHWVNPSELALVSPSGRSIALQSFTPSRAPLFRIEIIGDSKNAPPTDGTFFVEVFDDRLGHRRASIELGVTGIDFIAISNRTGWLTERHLILGSTHTRLENFVVCDCERGR